MSFHISRDGQVFGPYSIEDIHRYLGTGNVLLSDLAKSEEMPQWIPVSQLIAAAPAGSPLRPPVSVWPAPPNLHWALMALFSVLTCSLFTMVWNLVLASWFNRINPARRVLTWYAVATVLMLLEGGWSSHHRLMHPGVLHPGTVLAGGLLGGSFGLVVWIFRIFTRFNFRAALEEHYNTVEPIGLRLSGVLTFFFGGIYFQYKLNEINQVRLAQSYAGVIR